MQTTTPLNIRNVAVIAHVDHGKTTLVDALLKQTHVFRDNEEEMHQEQILDRNELERERGITILAKNCSIQYQGTKINIIDTPGHADFSGEVERTLSMADGALLIIDAQEGPMPQTRSVLKLALALNLKVIVVINNIDKKHARVDESMRRVGDLFLDMARSDGQLDFPVLYAIGKRGVVFDAVPTNIDAVGSVKPLLDTILSAVPAPHQPVGQSFKMVVSSLDYDAHLGRIAIGKIHQGTVSEGARVVRSQNPHESFPVASVMVASGLGRVKTSTAFAGDIVAISGIGELSIGDTIADPSDRAPLPAPFVSEPTLHITVGPNTSPFAGREGQFTTSRQLAERLARELENNVSLRVETLQDGKMKVSGRGELHLSILLETMRREGYEMEVGKPEVITKDIDGVVSEPVEEVVILVLSEYVGAVTQELGRRMGMLTSMNPVSETETEFVYTMPTRAYLGLRNALLTLTKGSAIVSSHIVRYEPLGRPLSKIRKGTLLASESGTALEYGLRNVKGTGAAFIKPGDQVYEGMIIGVNSKDNDLELNVCKEKNLTNHRTKSHQGITKLAPDLILSLEQSLDFLQDDELLEITPQSLRLRKKLLTDIDRRRAVRSQEH